MATRFSKRFIFTNNDPLYQQKMFDKGVKSFKQYNTAEMMYPTAEKIQRLERVLHVWKQGDSFEKLAFQYYQDSTYWWLIAFFNKTPTEQHVSVGDNIHIPIPLYEILNIIG